HRNQSPWFHQQLGKMFRKYRPQSLQAKLGPSRTFYHSLSLGTGLCGFLNVITPQETLPLESPIPVLRTTSHRIKGLHDFHPLVT
ncbi:hypothetical protein HispidOSU_029812, partial [Sigmodon hispidus]